MNLCKPPILVVFLFVLLFSVLPAHSQDQGSQSQSPQSNDQQPSSSLADRIILGLDAGETSDKFGGLARTTTPEVGVEGKLAILERASKEGDPNIVAGGEILAPGDTSSHAPEFALFGGPEFYFGPHMTFGIHLQLRKLYTPSSEEPNNLFFSRYKMTLFELPVVANFKFGPHNRVLLQVQGTPEFQPHYTNPTQTPSTPHPNLDHGYAFRGSLGYSFGRWYAKATYGTRYLKFMTNTNNPLQLYNWRTDQIFGSVGLRF